METKNILKEAAINAWRRRIIAKHGDVVFEKSNKVHETIPSTINAFKKGDKSKPVSSFCNITNKEKPIEA